MQKNLLTILLICSLGSGYSQSPSFEKPDYKKIQALLSSKNSADLYPGLMNRYLQDDISLTAEDFRILYYGSFFQQDYSAFGSSQQGDSLKKILRKPAWSDSDDDAVIRLENQALNSRPFSIRAMNVLAYAYGGKGETALHDAALFRMKNIVRTILSTGDGQTEKTAWHVITVEDEYDILDVLGYAFGGEQSLTNGGCDYLKVKVNKEGVAGLYFDVNMILAEEKKELEGNHK